MTELIQTYRIMSMAKDTCGKLLFPLSEAQVNHFCKYIIKAITLFYNVKAISIADIMCAVQDDNMPLEDLAKRYVRIACFVSTTMT